MNFEKDDCLIDSLSNTNRASIVCLSSVRAKFANGATNNSLFQKFFFSVYGCLFQQKLFFFVLNIDNKFRGYS